MTKSLIVDPDTCTGCELCVDTCPDVFKMNSDAIAEVFNPEGDSKDNIQQAIDDCPSSAISWKE